MALPGAGMERWQQGEQGGHADKGWEAGSPRQECFGLEGLCPDSWRLWGTFQMT